MFVILDIKFRFANTKWNLCQNIKVSKYDQPCRQNFYKYGICKLLWDIYLLN